VEVRFHPLVQRDVAEALKYYFQVSDRLADEFNEEVSLIIAQAAANPLRYHLADRGFRRANLRRFPYHILYEIRSNILLVMHVRHNKRHPDYGMQRT
jgi:plasmid stabilization system protein ParE